MSKTHRDATSFEEIIEEKLYDEPPMNIEFRWWREKKMEARKPYQRLQISLAKVKLIEPSGSNKPSTKIDSNTTKNQEPTAKITDNHLTTKTFTDEQKMH